MIWQHYSTQLRCTNVKQIYDPLQTLIPPESSDLLACLYFELVEYGECVFERFSMILKVLYGVNFGGVVGHF